MKLWVYPVRITLVAIALLVTSWLRSNPAQALTLNDAVSESLQANHKLRAAAEELEETRLRIRQAFAGYLPTIDFSAGRGREWVNTPTTREQDQGGLTLDRGQAGLNISQPIFDGFNTVYKVEQAQAQLRSSGFSYQDIAESLTLEVAETFLETLKQRQLLDLAKESITVHSDILIKTRQTAQLGLTADMDVRQSESRLALIASELASTEGALRNANTRFTALVGFPPGALNWPMLDKNRFPTTRGAALEVAMQRHPALQAAAADLNATRAEGKANAASLWPKISLDMAVSDTANISGSRSYSQDASAMLQFKYNFFRGGADLSKFKESSHKAARFREKFEQTRSQIEDKVNRAWNALTASRSRLQSLEKHLNTTKSVNRDHQEQYRLGIQSLLDLLNSENELHAAKQLWIEENSAFMTESCRLLAAMGQLNEILTQQEEPAPVAHKPNKADINPDAKRLVAPGPVASKTDQPLARPDAKSLVAPPTVASKRDQPVARPDANQRVAPHQAVKKTVAIASAPKTTINAPQSANALSAEEEDELTRLGEILLDEQPASMSLEISPTPPNSTTPTTPSSTTSITEEALSALAATVNAPVKTATKEFSHAMIALAETVSRSMQQNPPPTQPSPIDDNSQDQAIDTNAPPKNKDPGDLQDLERIPLLDFINLMTNDETDPSAKIPAPDLLQYTVQVGAFQDEASAVNLIGQLQNKGYDIFLREKQDKNKRPWYLVWIGRHDTENEAQIAHKAFTNQESRPAFITPIARTGISTISKPLPFIEPASVKSETSPLTTPDAEAVKSASSPLTTPHAEAVKSASSPLTTPHAEAVKPASSPLTTPHAEAIKSASSPLTTHHPQEYAVQVAGFIDQRETEKKLIQLSSKGYDLYVCETRDPKGHIWQTIWIGRYPNKKQAQAAAEAFFHQEGESAVIIEVLPDTPSAPRIITRIGTQA